MTDATDHPEPAEDDLDLVPEALKDLTASPDLAAGVAGGATTGQGPFCECGTC